MATDVQSRPAPEPGTPAAVIGTMLGNAMARGHSAAAARVSSFSGHPPATLTEGDDVTAAVTYRLGDAEHTDVERLDLIWRLAEAGATLIDLRCPDEHPPITFVAAAMVWDARGTRHDLVVIDRRGGQPAALASPVVVHRKPVGQIMRAHVLKYANAAERRRARSSIVKLTKENQGPDGLEPVGPLVFGTGVAEWLMGGDPTKRGLDEGRAQLQWSYKTVDPDGTEHIIAVSDPDFAPEPVSRAATAGASTVSIDELARTKAQAQGANVWNRQVDPKGLDQPPATRPAQKFDLSEKDPNWASEVTVKKVAPRPLKTKTGTCTFCGAAGVVLRGDDDPRCLECFKSDNAARARMAEFKEPVPTPVYDPFRRKPEDDEIKPRPNDTREWNDSAGEFGSALADNRAPYEAVLALGNIPEENAKEGLKDRWRRAGLTELEISILLDDQAGKPQSEIADRVGLHQASISRRIRTAKKKLEKS